MLESLIKLVTGLKTANKRLSKREIDRIKSDLCLAAPDFLMIDPYKWTQSEVAEFLTWWLGQADDYRIKATDKKEAAAELAMLGLEKLPNLTKPAAALFVDQWLNALDEL